VFFGYFSRLSANPLIELASQLFERQEGRAGAGAVAAAKIIKITIA